MSLQLISSAALLTSFAIISVAGPANRKPVWSKKGVAFPVGCERPFNGCDPLRIPSPDSKSDVEIEYERTPDYPDIRVASLRVTSLGKVVGVVGPVGTVESELTWSPDSKAFFINGANNGYGDDHVAVHRLDLPGLGPGFITHEVEQDMVRSFPPCRAKDPIDTCAELEAEPQAYVGVVAVDWVGDSSRLVVMAEVPCSSSMGGIMCQVLGYELEVPSGKILRRMEPRDFAKRWQRSMAWKFEDPGPPGFGDK